MARDAANGVVDWLNILDVREDDGAFRDAAGVEVEAEASTGEVGESEGEGEEGE